MIILLLETLLIASTFYSIFQLLMPQSYKTLTQNVQRHFILLVILFFYIVTSFLNSNFILNYVFEHSHSTLPWFFKVAAVWSGQEGSTLLFFIFAQGSFLLACIFMCPTQKNLLSQNQVLMKYILFQVILMTAYIITSDLFALNIPFVPHEGTDLNPLLQNYAMTYHPPFLLAGQAGFFAVSILSSLNSQTSLHRTGMLFNKITYLSLGILTLGITFGSMWAYNVLGWGGYWYWDPVENISLIPWLLGFALLHTTPSRRTIYNLIWAIILTGMLIVRSDSLISVHSFAQNINNQGVLLALILSSIAYGAFDLYKNYHFHLQLNTHSKNIGAWTLLSLGIIIFLALVLPIFYTFISERSAHLSENFYKTLLPPLLVSALAFVVIRKISFKLAYLGSFLTALCFYYFDYSILHIILLILLAIVSLSTQPWSSKTYIHHALIFTILLMTMHASFSQEYNILTHIGKYQPVGPYHLYSLEPKEVPGEFGTTKIIYPFIFKYKNFFNQNEKIEIYPYQEVHHRSNMWTSQMGFSKGIFDEFTFTLGEKTSNSKIYLSIHFNPFVRIIWLIGVLFGMYLVIDSLRLLLPRAALRYNGVKKIYQSLYDS